MNTAVYILLYSIYMIINSKQYCYLHYVVAADASSAKNFFQELLIMYCGRNSTIYSRIHTIIVSKYFRYYTFKLRVFSQFAI